MKYSYREGIKKQKSRRWLILPVALLVGGAYLAVNVLAPTIFYVVEPPDRVAKELTTTMPRTDMNSLYMPKINTAVDIVDTGGRDDAALELGALHRAVRSGNPKSGGTYVLTAYRFKLGLTPQQTYQKSAFYHLDKLQTDDDIYVDYEGTRYAYKVLDQRSERVELAKVEEKNSSIQLTLYSAQANDAQERDVVTAKLVGTIVWLNGQPKLQAL